MPRLASRFPLARGLHPDYLAPGAETKDLGLRSYLGFHIEFVKRVNLDQVDGDPQY